MFQRFIKVLIYLGLISIYAQNKEKVASSNSIKESKVSINSIYNYDYEKITIHDVENMTIEKDFSITFLNKSGEKNFAILEYSSPVRKVKKLKGAIYDKDDKIV